MTETETKRGPGRPRKRNPLVPSAELMASPAVEDYAYFQVGALPSSPVTCIFVAGVAFAVMSEVVSDAPPGGRSDRIPFCGSIYKLTKRKLEELEALLPYKVIRFDEPPETLAIAKRERDPINPMGVMDVTRPIGGPGDDVQTAKYEKRARRGTVVSIPTPAEIEKRRENRLPVKTYQPGQWDEPVAAHIFIQRCPDQKHPDAATRYPDPLVILDPVTKEAVGGTGLPELGG